MIFPTAGRQVGFHDMDYIKNLGAHGGGRTDTYPVLTRDRFMGLT
jgi:hypothetical protein